MDTEKKSYCKVHYHNFKEKSATSSPRYLIIICTCKVVLCNDIHLPYSDSSKKLILAFKDKIWSNPTEIRCSHIQKNTNSVSPKRKYLCAFINHEYGISYFNYS